VIFAMLLNIRTINSGSPRKPLSKATNIDASVGYNKFKNKEALAVVAGGPGTDDSYIDYKVGVNRNILGILAELDDEKK